MKQGGDWHDDWVNDMLTAWGDWNARRDDGGPGRYKCPLGRMGEASGGGALSEIEVGVMRDQDALRVEAAVRELPEVHKTIVRVWYVQTNMPEAQRAKRLGMALNSAKRYLGDARRTIARFLSENKRVDEDVDSRIA